MLSCTAQQLVKPTVKLLTSCVRVGCWHLLRISFRTTGLLKLTCSSVGTRPALFSSTAWLPAAAISSMAAAANSARPATRWSHKNASAGAIMSVASLLAMQREIHTGSNAFSRNSSGADASLQGGGPKQQTADLAPPALHPEAAGMARRCRKGPGQARLGFQTKAGMPAMA